MEYTTIKELIALAGDGKISDVVLACQAQEDRQDKKKLIDYMRHCLHVMEESVICAAIPAWWADRPTG